MFYITYVQNHCVNDMKSSRIISERVGAELVYVFKIITFGRGGKIQEVEVTLRHYRKYKLGLDLVHSQTMRFLFQVLSLYLEESFFVIMSKRLDWISTLHLRCQLASGCLFRQWRGGFKWLTYELTYTRNPGHCYLSKGK